MEKDLFDWDGWDGEAQCMIFYNPILKVQIGKYPVGTKFDTATIIQENGRNVLQFVTNEGVLVAEYKIRIQVEDK